MKFYCDGKRVDMGKMSSKQEISKSLESVFENFSQVNHRAERIRRKHELSENTFSQMTPEQDACFNRTNEAFDLTFIGHVTFPTYDKSRGFLTQNQAAHIIEELVKACTINSSDHTDTSLTAFSVKNSCKTKRQEGFEYMKPKMIVINKPATEIELSDEDFIAKFLKEL